MFTKNKYYSYYFNIIRQAQSRDNGDIYVEKHHIIPKSIGGNNSKDNIVSLTAREHFVCHRLLTKITTGIAKSKMANATWRMVFASKKHKRYKVNSRTYEAVKIEMANANRERSKKYRHSEESKIKISLSKIGKSREWNDEWREKIRLANIGLKKKPCSDERKKKIGDANRGRIKGPMSIESKQKLSASKRGKKIHVDPITGKRYMV
jgi:hypothetical protein